MLRYKTKTSPGLVALYTTSGQETDRVHSYNPGARMGLRQKNWAFRVPPFKATQGYNHRHGESFVIAAMASHGTANTADSSNTAAARIGH